MGILGFGNPDPMTSLLGVDMGDMRRRALMNGLAAAGFTLMGDRNIGNAGGAFLAGTNQARDDYMRSAFDAYRLKSAEEDRAYRRERDALEDERWNKEFGLRQKDAAWQSAERQRQSEAWQREDDLRAGQEQAVDAWANTFKSQGGDLFDPGMQGWLRSQGVAGVNPADTQRYGNMQPYMQAGDYAGAFQQMTAEAARPEQFTLGEGDIRYDEYGNPIAVGPAATPKAPQVETFYDTQTGQQYKAQWDAQTQQWVPVGGKKADENGITITNPDGTTMQIGGSGSKSTEADRRATLLAQQIVGQEAQLMAGFDALASPTNFAGSRVPGGATIMSPEAQIAQDSIMNTVANWLYLTSGATATDAEIERQTAMVTPSPFDDPQRVAAKKARLKSIIDTMKARAGMQSAPQSPDASALKQKYGLE